MEGPSPTPRRPFRRQAQKASSNERSANPDSKGFEKRRNSPTQLEEGFETHGDYTNPALKGFEEEEDDDDDDDDDDEDDGEGEGEGEGAEEEEEVPMDVSFLFQSFLIL